MFRPGFTRPGLVAVCICLALLVIGAVGVRYVGAVRSGRIATTALEIRRGNYFAWRQAGRWWDRLSESEQHQLLAACEDWAKVSSTLQSKDKMWPTASRVSSFLAGGLNFDRMCHPAFYQVPLAMYWPGKYRASNE
jgi:hypothetical protein